MLESVAIGTAYWDGMNWSSPAYQVGFQSSSLELNRVFGCLVFYRVMQPLKLEPRARPGVFVGIEKQGTHATYKIYDFEKRSLVTRFVRDLYFFEDKTWSKYVSE